MPRKTDEYQDRETEFYGITFKSLPKPKPVHHKPVSQVPPMAHEQCPKPNNVSASPTKYTGPEINVDSGLEMEASDGQGDRLRSKIALGVKQLMTMSEAVKRPTSTASEVVPIRVSDPNKSLKVSNVVQNTNTQRSESNNEHGDIPPNPEDIRNEDEVDLYDFLPPQQKPQSPSRVKTVLSVKTSTPISNATDSAYQSDYSSLQSVKRGINSKYASYAEGCVTNASAFMPNAETFVSNSSVLIQNKEQKSELLREVANTQSKIEKLINEMRCSRETLDDTVTHTSQHSSQIVLDNLSTNKPQNPESSPNLEISNTVESMQTAAMHQHSGQAIANEMVNGNESQENHQSYSHIGHHVMNISTPRDPIRNTSRDHNNVSRDNNIVPRGYKNGPITNQVIQEVDENTEENGQQKDDVPGEDESGVIFITAGIVISQNTTHAGHILNAHNACTILTYNF